MLDVDLPEIPIFQGLNREQVEELNTWLERIEFSEGQVILKEDDPPNGLYVIARGTIENIKQSKIGPVTLVELEGPTVLGEMGLLTGEGRSATAVARSRVVTGFLSIETFEKRIAANNLTALRIALNLGRIVSHRMREAIRRIGSLAEALNEMKLSEEQQSHVTRVLDSVTRHALTGKGD